MSNADKLKFTVPHTPDIHMGVFVSLCDCKAEKKSPPKSLKGAQRNNGKNYKRATSLSSGVSRPIQEINPSVIQGEAKSTIIPIKPARTELLRRILIS